MIEGETSARVLEGPGVMVPIGAALVMFGEPTGDMIVPVIAAFVAGGMPKSMGGRLRETSTIDAEVRINEPVSASTEANQPDTLGAEQFDIAGTPELAAESALFRNRRSRIL